MALFVPRVVFSPNRCRAPVSAYRRSVVPVFNLLDEAFKELAQVSTLASTNARRTGYINPSFDVRETEQGYVVDGELPGIAQENIEIEFSDENTLTIKGKSEGKVESSSQQPTTATPPEMTSATAIEESSDKPHQATVEDDFEELTNESDTASSELSEKVKDSAPVVAAEPEEQQRKQDAQRRWVSERSFGSFSRSFRFPKRIDQDAVTASLKNGVLSIIVPKVPVPESRRVQIE